MNPTVMLVLVLYFNYYMREDELKEDGSSGMSMETIALKHHDACPI